MICLLHKMKIHSIHKIDMFKKILIVEILKKYIDHD